MLLHFVKSTLFTFTEVEVLPKKSKTISKTKMQKDKTKTHSQTLTFIANNKGSSQIETEDAETANNTTST